MTTARYCSTSASETAGGDGETKSTEITANDAVSTLEPGSSSAAAAPFSVEPIDAVPPPAAGQQPGPAEPGWIREKLGLQPDHPLHFIAEKRVQRSDLDVQQSRLSMPLGDAVGRLLPLLSDEQRRAAKLANPWERPEPQACHRARGKKLGRLVVPVYVNRAGDRTDAQLTRWDSNGSTVLKFADHGSFVDASGLEVMDEIQIWAFLQDGGPCLVIHKVGDDETTATPPAAAAGGQQSKSSSEEE
ncbi:hypothetical protein CFC21_072365 [Triticum aestivum]|uniref:Uncharacterized protein n=2 Tax=Triticum aestivum TaxID=4565 RepID=A0A3B6LN34_WHEAT|nr:hypothetical protein CFC21_072365 [Triticum aestivum]